MHATKVGWAGKAFALATSNDSGGRKSRIRRSKEERKSMVESFIKKYQKTNNGNFPSLNLTHKEVGGSFYTVREIVREIIQKNRVLAPPKVSLEEQDHSDFFEQHPLGSISMEPQIDLSLSDRIHIVTHTVPNKYQITSEENRSYPLELDNEHIIKGVSKVAEKDEGSDRAKESHHYQDSSMEVVSNCREQSPNSKSHEFENEKIVNGVELLEENLHSDEPLITKVDFQDNNDSALLSSQKDDGADRHRLKNEQYQSKNDQTFDKTKEFAQSAQDIEASQALKSHMNSNVVVETFPLRPVPWTIQHDKGTFTQSSSGFVNEKYEEKLPDSTVELNAEQRDEKVVLNLQNPSLESSKYSSHSKPSMLDVGDIASLESKVSSSTECLISDESTAVGRKSSNQYNSNMPKGNNSTLDRIDLKTWEGALKKSTRPESNPLLALVKAFISSFVKFWTE